MVVSRCVFYTFKKILDSVKKSSFSKLEIHCDFAYDESLWLEKNTLVKY